MRDDETAKREVVCSGMIMRVTTTKKSETFEKMY